MHNFLGAGPIEHNGIHFWVDMHWLVLQNTITHWIVQCVMDWETIPPCLIPSVLFPSLLHPQCQSYLLCMERLWPCSIAKCFANFVFCGSQFQQKCVAPTLGPQDALRTLIKNIGSHITCRLFSMSPAQILSSVTVIELDTPMHVSTSYFGVSVDIKERKTCYF